METVLIAGGCGFIGHKVAIEFLNSGYKVIIVDNWMIPFPDPAGDGEHKYAYRIRLLKNAGIIQESILNTDSINRIFLNEKPGIVVHLANSPNAAFANNKPFFAAKQIIEGTLSLLEASVNAGVKKFVYVSSSMVYGDFQTNCISEDHSTDPKELYGLFKLMAENLVKNYHRLFNLTYSILRPIAVYGPTGHETFVLTRFINETRKGGTIRILGKETRLDFNFVDDVARGILLAATKPEGNNQTFNLGSGLSHKLVDIADFLKTLNPHLSIIIEDADPLYPKRGALNISKVKKMLGYTPQYTLKAGLKLFYDSL